ncbi:histidine kinase [Winogradskyella sp.]|uniref:sensor histidine kinase n=1 Tax=Winogradskyella sp. TaxID=1883156 RepID=UPI0034581AC7
MKNILKEGFRNLLKTILFFLVLIPILVIGYIFFSKTDSVELNLSIITVAIIIVCYSVLLVIGIVWLVQQLRSVLSIKNEMHKSEILHLQSQVNPHFFFNMLNTIYGTIDKDSALTKQLVLRLSDLMRYSIYEGNKQKVLLNDEVEFLQNYIYLHTIRYHKAIDVKFDIDIDDPKLEINPLLLIILLENAFKHGIEKLRENAFINVQLRTKNGMLDFGIENNFDENDSDEDNGLGISNLKRRLELVYPERYKLNIYKSNSIYKTYLEILL